MDEDVEQPKQEISLEELEDLEGEPLPNREVMSTVSTDPIGEWGTLPIEPPAV